MTRIPAATDSFPLIQIALQRTGSYLAACGVELDRQASLQLLSLLEEGLREKPDDLFAWLVAEAQRRFVPAQAQLPPGTPPLQRGSIRYGEY